ncbi:MAG: hypothetical protein IJ481_02855 [Alphaproteobacteria bacterium]|nr:hypothetical protein [Alphaproteobacteria bacterium]
MIAQRLFKSILISGAIVVGVVGSLQLSYIQKKIIGFAVGNHAKIDFKSTEGFFPFLFKVNGLRIDVDSTNIDIDYANVNLSKHLFNLKRLDIGSINIQQGKKTDSMPLDYICAIIPAFNQKLVKNFSIKKIKSGELEFSDIEYKTQKKTHNRSLTMLTPFGKADAAWSFKKGDVQVDAVCGTLFNLKLDYNNSNKAVNLDAKYNGSEYKADGKLKKFKEFEGSVKIPFFKDGIKTKLSLKKDEVFADITLKEPSINGKVSYNISNSKIIVQSIDIPEYKAKVASFSIPANQKVPELKLNFEKGSVIATDVFLDIDKFNFDKLKIIDVAIEQFGDFGVTGLVSGTGIYHGNYMDLDLVAKNCKSPIGKLPEVDVKAICKKDIITADVEFDFFMKRHRVRIDISADNWIPNKDSKIKLNTKGALNFLGSKIFKKGLISYNIGVGGSIANPSVLGNIDFKNGMYVNPENGVYIKDITANCVLNNNAIVIKNIKAFDCFKQKGNVTGSGKISLSDSTLDTDISLKVDKLRPITVPWLDATFSGNLSLQGDMFGSLKLAGSLFSEKPTIDITGLVISNVRNFDIAQQTSKSYLKKKIHLKV